jgi:pSer/pThr/pTyr-binding forkhead associated (FHA) protein
MTIKCPNCNHDEIEGAIFCSECGEKLFVDDENMETRKFQDSQSLFEGIPTPPKSPSGMLTNLKLLLVRTGQLINLPTKNEFTIGRISEGQAILPDIDLTDYDAYSLGVSRLHITFRIKSNELFVVDLGASNGTRVNKQRITPYQEILVSHGDLIAMGGFLVQILTD